MRPVFRFRSVLAALSVLLLAAPALAESLSYGGRERDYILRFPEGVERPPLILVLHGGGGRGRQIDRHTGLTQQATAEGFALVYPDAIDRQWNDGRGDPNSQEHAATVDDVGFLSALVADLGARGLIDPARVFVMGVSNGGMMTYRMVCERADLFAGAVAVVANLPKAMAPQCHPSRPVPLLVLNGTADPLMPYDGGDIVVFGLNRGSVISTEATLERFSIVNGCSGRQTVAVVDPAPDDRVTPEHEVFTGCTADLALWRYVGGGHGWPGAGQYRAEGLVGIVAHRPTVNDLALEFFRAQLGE
jgi:polyhydroxybutyrate depolymerase